MPTGSAYLPHAKEVTMYEKCQAPVDWKSYDQACEDQQMSIEPAQFFGCNPHGNAAQIEQIKAAAVPSHTEGAKFPRPWEVPQQPIRFNPGPSIGPAPDLSGHEEGVELDFDFACSPGEVPIGVRKSLVHRDADGNIVNSIDMGCAETGEGVDLEKRKLDHHY